MLTIHIPMKLQMSHHCNQACSMLMLRQLNQNYRRKLIWVYVLLLIGRTLTAKIWKKSYFR